MCYLVVDSSCNRKPHLLARGLLQRTGSWTAGMFDVAELLLATSSLSATEECARIPGPRVVSWKQESSLSRQRGFPAAPQADPRGTDIGDAKLGTLYRVGACLDGDWVVLDR